MKIKGRTLADFSVSILPFAVYLLIATVTTAIMHRYFFPVSRAEPERPIHPASLLRIHFPFVVSINSTFS